MKKKSLLAFFIIQLFLFNTCFSSIDNKSPQPNYSFTENKGQLLNEFNLAENEVLFYSNLGGINIYLCKDKLYYVIKQSINNDKLIVDENEMQNEADQIEIVRVELKLLNCNTNITAKTEDEISLISNYYLPSCPSGISAKNFKKIKFENVYPRINWILYFSELEGRTSFKYDFEVMPGADYRQIKFQYNGADSILKSKSGSIEIETLFGNIQDSKPISFLAETKIVLKSSFKINNNQIGFEVSGYNKNEKLIIDPTILWSTYFGYNGDEHGRAITVGADGFIYTGGFTNSTNFPILNGYSSPQHNAFDGWIMKLTPSYEPLWITYYGGSLADVCRSLEVDSAGNVFAGMETRSADMPTFNAYQPAKSDTDDFFILKLNPAGLPIWASFYGGNNLDALRRIKLGHLGYLVASGYSRSTNFPMISPLQANNAGDADAVIMKVSMSTGFPIASTYFGGSGYDEPVGITFDNNNNIFVVGTTMSSNFPVQNAFQSVLKGLSDIFVLKLNPNMTVAWSTYIGSTKDDDGNGIGVDTMGNCFVLGTSKKNNYPVLNAWQPVYGGASDAVISKFNANGVLIWSTYAGGQGTEDGNSIAIDQSGNVIATGYTLSTAFPMINATQSVFGGVHDAFILRYSNAGKCLLSTYYGGAGTEHARSVAVDNNSNAFIVGSTSSTNLLLVNPIQTVNGSAGSYDADAFFLKINYSTFQQPTILVTGQNPKCNINDAVDLISSSSFGNHWSTGDTTQTITVSANGNYFVTTVDSSGAGINSDTVTVSTNPISSVVFDSLAIINLCVGSDYILTAPTVQGATYYWTRPNGFVSSLNNLTLNNIQQNDLGIYSCLISLDSCSKICKKINLVNLVNIVSPTHSNMSGSNCQGGQFTLFTDSLVGAQYLWSGPNGFTANTRTVAIVNAQPINSGDYFIKYIINGCESLASVVSVVIYSQPISNAGPDLIACNGNNNVNLDGAIVTDGIGTWTCTTLPHAIIQNPNIANSLATNLRVGTNQFKWTVSNGSCIPVYDIAIVKYTTAANFGCIKPSNLNHIINGNSATLNWSNCTIANQFQVRITFNGVNYNISTTNYSTVLNNLAPGTYTWKVRSNCNGVWSGYSTSKSFGIDSSPKYEVFEFAENNHLILFPIPVADQLNISFQIETTGKYKLELIDPAGRILVSEINEFEEGYWSQYLFTGGLSSGVYFIRLTSPDNISKINKFIKQ